MLWAALDLRGYSLGASDGALGEVTDFLFDDENWMVRYAVVDTGRWLPGRKVLIVPGVLGRPDRLRSEIPVSLSRKMVRGSPTIDSDRPLNRQMEMELHRWYGWAPYFGGHDYEGLTASAPGIVGAPEDLGDEQPEESPQLRSMNEIRRYRVLCSDGEAGLVMDFLIEDEAWSIRYIVVDDGGWITGKDRVISTRSVTDISWAEKELSVALGQRQITASPEYDPSKTSSRAYEDRP